ncbi:MAG TPA: ferritin-like domain-containing protein [Terriglobales bacterium]|nr:ferritin-like domain-containing protein [Terriglobales bacterium]
MKTTPPAPADLALLPESNRRRFARNLGLAAAVAGGSALLQACGGSSTAPVLPVISGPSGGLSDADYLNFALNLAYLEAEFYAFATTGKGIDAKLQGTPSGTTTNGAQVAFTDPAVQAIAVELAADELAHVTLLRGLLGSAAVGKPAIDLNALKSGFGSDAEFLTLARAFEDVAVSAYAGSAEFLLASNSIATAVLLLGGESEHAGNLRLAIVEKGITVTPLDASDVVPTATTYFSADASGLAVRRTTRQVLNIVYGGTGASGLFFPSGFNGKIVS